jgi:hypothetical protein
MDWRAEVLKARPNLSISSQKTYASKLKKMDEFIPNWRTLDADELLQQIDLLEYTDTYRKGLLVAVLVIIGMDETNKYSGKLNTLRKAVYDKTAQYQAKNNIMNNEIASDNQANNIISYPELAKYIDKVGRDAVSQQEDMIYCILYSLLHIPVRNDLAGMKFIGKREYNKIDTTEEQNYLMHDKGKNKYYYVYYQNDTTTKTRPKHLQELHPDVKRIVRRYIRKHDIHLGDVIYPISKNNLSQLLTKTSQKYIGKNIGTTLIRKIVASHKFQHIKPDVAEQTEMAAAMGHSVATQNAVYNKAIPR